MNVELVQFDVKWQQPSINLDKVRSLISTEADLIVLPEMFLTGFTMDPGGLAETMQSSNVQSLQAMADENQTAILGSLVIREEDKLFNRLILFSPNRPIQFMTNATFLPLEAKVGCILLARMMAFFN